MREEYNVSSNFFFFSLSLVDRMAFSMSSLTSYDMYVDSIRMIFSSFKSSYFSRASFAVCIRRSPIPTIRLCFSELSSTDGSSSFFDHAMSRNLIVPFLSYSWVDRIWLLIVFSWLMQFFTSSVVIFVIIHIYLVWTSILSPELLVKFSTDRYSTDSQHLMYRFFVIRLRKFSIVVLIHPTEITPMNRVPFQDLLLCEYAL